MTLAALDGDRHPYGLSTKPGIDICAILNMEINGNGDTCTDKSDNFEFLWNGDQPDNNPIIGRINEQGITVNVDNPKCIILDNLYVHNTVRSNIVLDAPDTVAIIGKLRLADSQIDHLIYTDTANICQFGSVSLSGFCRSGFLVSSGSQWGLIEVSDIQENPNSNNNHAFDFNCEFIVDDRSDTRGSQIGKVSIRGDLKPLSKQDANGQDTGFRKLIRLRSFHSDIDSISVASATSEDYALDIVALHATNNAPGNISGCKIGSILCSGIPESARVLAVDPEKYGTNVENLYLGYYDVIFRSGAGYSGKGGFFLGASSIRGMHIGPGRIEVGGFSNGGCSYLVDDEVSTELDTVTFSECRMIRADNTMPPAATVAGSRSTTKGFKIDSLTTRNSKPKDDVFSFIEFNACRFVGGVYYYPKFKKVSHTSASGDTSTTLFDHGSDVGFGIPVGQGAYVQASVFGLTQDGASIFAVTRKAVVHNDSGTLRVLGTASNISGASTADMNDASVTFSGSGSNFNILFAGVSGIDLKLTVEVEILYSYPY